mmetsp:Transcript_34140/g.75732  ORF Transcript_34140/g.75732 Transcript_34140/m.75732 type:complete len:142 (-) Transcript_34140:261-686(-)|eukprot:CAMPEP_0202901440 /NCGR_PEP_ID=MMETSP1392-20130828/14255_1 /ASSEMBLY_ACC=CAM_ASM_000868 /TAXON_ID=225041 /ORGANISM="Chlamydomonas chlamydogama, Strain SAG 11-48b" /LENGTH=141 /DNA_ID=CAMNT_0049587997 /DNA_START=134 /DNA_END=562 /DNA_ORIENTATION=-
MSGDKHRWDIGNRTRSALARAKLIIARCARPHANIPVYGRHDPLLGTISVTTSIPKKALRHQALELAKQQFKGPLYFKGLRQQDGTVDALDSEELLDLNQIAKAKAFVTIEPKQKKAVDREEFNQLKAMFFAKKFFALLKK